MGQTRGVAAAKAAAVKTLANKPHNPMEASPLIYASQKLVGGGGFCGSGGKKPLFIFSLGMNDAGVFD